MDWEKTVCDFVIFRGAAVVQLLGTSIEKPRQARAIQKNHDRRVRFRKTTAGTCDSEKQRQARAIPKNHGEHVRFRKTTAGACDSEKTRQARAIPKNHGRHVRFRKTTAGACDSEKPRQARQGAPGNPMVGEMQKKLRF